MAGDYYRDPEKNDELELLKEDDELYHFRLPVAEPDIKNLPPAKSQWSIGRSCPKCAGQLIFFEQMSESGYILLQCKKCLKKWFQKDLDPQNYDPLDDKDKLTLPFDNALYRDIPAERVLYYMNRVDRSKQKEDKG